ncbi:DNA-directed RNA polymerase sigma-70 factor [Parapedobacter defluvii]|uniref:RNA polymerase sigma factor n=1 Tax=Parapedobacter defluvii TaxID=2045106 RepID=A0ABQ1KXU1_9SPHI|nr:RNA polymerase sigma-70 factor [Parapedobacter defluvii]GGC14527.1 DNA-directed RNA polymerase sigma-70 factor [Parapedobacter defluvii]
MDYAKQLDIVLLEQIRDGNEQAFAALYDRYAGRLYGNLIKLVKDRDVAQELLQDVFLKIWEKRKSIRVESSFAAYLFAITKHMALNFSRRVVLDAKVVSSLAAEAPDGYSHIEEGMIAKELERLYDNAVNALPPKRRVVYIRCKHEGKTYEQVSRELGISTSTINDHMVKALRFIEQHLRYDGVVGLILIAGLPYF